MSGVATAIVGGAAVSYFGSQKAAGAATDAANAEMAQSQQWQNHVQDQENQALPLVNTPSQIAAFDQSISAQSKLVGQQQQLAQSLSPELIGIGQQAQQLLNGQSAPALANIQNQRNLQRQDLVNQLNQQMGPGGQTSTAGMQALNQFDNETANSMSQAQQSYTQTLLGASLSAPGVMNQLGGANQQLAQMQTMSPGAQQANLMAQFTQAGSGAQQAAVQAAGGQFAGAAIQGQEMSNLGGAAIGLGGAIAGGRFNSQNQQSTPSGPLGPPGSLSSSSLSMPQMGSQYGMMASSSPVGSGALGSNISPPSINYGGAGASYGATNGPSPYLTNSFPGIGPGGFANGMAPWQQQYGQGQGVAGQ